MTIPPRHQAPPFELTVTVPADRRFGGTVGAVAREAAQQAGCQDVDAARFGSDVEEAFLQCAADGVHDRPGQVEVLYRRGGGALEVILTGGNGVKIARTLRIDV